MKFGDEVFLSRLISNKVFDVDGGLIGKIKDVVVVLSQHTSSRGVGFIVEVHGKRHIFVPLTRVTSINHDQIVITGLLNFRRFQKHELEYLVFAEVFGRIVELDVDNGAKDDSNDNLQWRVEDISLRLQSNMEWTISSVFVRRLRVKSGITTLTKRILGRQGETRFISVDEMIRGDKSIFDSDHIIETLENMSAADAADTLLDLDKARQLEVIKDLDNERLADVLEEMPEADQAQILGRLATEEAADVLEEMEPDDAADLLNTMPSEKVDELLEEMNPEEAEDVRKLMEYSDNTAGGLMTLNPVILTVNSTVASALAQIRQEKLSPTLASVVFVCKQPLEVPTGQFLGVLHYQQLLRLPPHQQIGNFIDKNIGFVKANASIDEVARVFATYNATIVPVLDDDNRLVGAITVDDVLDHTLPKDWRSRDIINGGRFEG